MHAELAVLLQIPYLVIGRGRKGKKGKGGYVERDGKESSTNFGNISTL